MSSSRRILYINNFWPKSFSYSRSFKSIFSCFFSLPAEIKSLSDSLFKVKITALLTSPKKMLEMLFAVLHVDCLHVRCAFSDTEWTVKKRKTSLLFLLLDLWNIDFFPCVHARKKKTKWRKWNRLLSSLWLLLMFPFQPQRWPSAHSTTAN